eukprot:1022484-Prymnesium_polylepis.1
MVVRLPLAGGMGAHAPAQIVRAAVDAAIRPAEARSRVGIRTDRSSGTVLDRRARSVERRTELDLDRWCLRLRGSRSRSEEGVERDVG